MLPVEKMQGSVCCKPRGQRLVLSSETPFACDIWTRSTVWVSGVVTATMNSVTSRNLTHRVLSLHQSADLGTPLCGRGRSCGLEGSKLPRRTGVPALPARPLMPEAGLSDLHFLFYPNQQEHPPPPALSMQTDPETLHCAEGRPPAVCTEPGPSSHLAFLFQVSKRSVARGPRHCVRSWRREACSFCLPQKALLEHSTTVTHFKSRQRARSQHLGSTNEAVIIAIHVASPSNTF